MVSTPHRGWRALCSAVVVDVSVHVLWCDGADLLCSTNQGRPCYIRTVHRSLLPVSVLALLTRFGHSFIHVHSFRIFAINIVRRCHCPGALSSQCLQRRYWNCCSSDVKKSCQSISICCDYNFLTCKTEEVWKSSTNVRMTGELICVTLALLVFCFLTESLIKYAVLYSIYFSHSCRSWL